MEIAMIRIKLYDSFFFLLFFLRDWLCSTTQRRLKSRTSSTTEDDPGGGRVGGAGAVERVQPGLTATWQPAPLSTSTNQPTTSIDHQFRSPSQGWKSRRGRSHHREPELCCTTWAQSGRNTINPFRCVFCNLEHSLGIPPRNFRTLLLSMTSLECSVLTILISPVRSFIWKS